MGVIAQLFSIFECQILVQEEGHMARHTAIPACFGINSWLAVISTPND